MFLSAYSAQRMKTDVSGAQYFLQASHPHCYIQEDDATMSRCKAAVDELVHDIQQTSQDAAGSGNGDRERYVIPPHLHDLHEAELPEAQRGLVISEIAQFREKAAIRERDRSREMREAIPSYAPNAPSRSAPAREWGRPQSSGANGQRAVGSGPQGYDKPVGFVKGQDGGDERSLAGKAGKTDEELEQERKEARRKDEENSFRDVRDSGFVS
jgi:RNA-binding protein 25